MTTETLPLANAWAEYKKQWKAGTEIIQQGDRLWKEITKLPGSSRVQVWASISEESYQAAAKVTAGYLLRLKADVFWRDAIVAEHGNARVTWEWDPEKEFYKCILENGQVYEP